MAGVWYGCVYSLQPMHTAHRTQCTVATDAHYIFPTYLVFNNPQKHPQFLSQYRKLRAAKQNETGILVNSFVKTFCSTLPVYLLY